MRLVSLGSKRFKEAVLSVLADAIEHDGEDRKENENRFKKLPDGWIYDRQLGIDWAPSSANRMNIEEAEKHCADAGGRLPTDKELMSLIDHSREQPATFDPFIADTKYDGWYWSSTRTCWNKNASWCVGFNYGSVSNYREDNGRYVRPVRASQCRQFEFLTF